ncbi:MAG TPA: hypothetical protein VEF76_13100 [Patescibacteria group bacterium]|nr:hypothetical protein [Patescibacteria group bacterium]
MSKSAEVVSIPTQVLHREGESQKNRILGEVMEALYENLPTHVQGSSDFRLSDGTRCWVRKRGGPRQKGEEGLCYQFEVIFSDGALASLEFNVRCSGWNRGD